MSWPYKNGIRKTGKETRYPEIREEIEAGRKTEIAMGGCIKSDLE